MYDTYFGLGKRPFASAPQVELYFPGAAIESARRTLLRCLQRGEGAGLVVGPSGTGKTLLCHMLAEELKGSFRVAALASGRLGTRRALLQAILYALGRPYRGMDEGEARLALVDYLSVGEDCPQGIVLLVDEAHTLPLKLLEEIRLLTNVVRDGQPLVRLVLAGGAVLEERFANPRLDSFSQRLTARCYLESLSRVETRDYISGQMMAAGSDEEIFPDEACRSVYQATDGVPRLINQVCDHALISAYVGQRRRIEPVYIEEAWAELQQLPTPWNGESPKQDTGIIEFGGLDDDAGQAEPSAEGPQLRISAGDDPAATGDEQSAGQLPCEESEDFQPLGTIGPEVELTFDEPAHPFQEQFEEEEVVTDRYVPPDEADQRQPSPVVELRHEESASAATAAETVSLRQGHPADMLDSEDEDMIIIDDAHDEVPKMKCSVAAVRRHEFGQLFARLRRG